MHSYSTAIRSDYCGRDLPVNPFDLISDEGDDICVSGIQDAGDLPNAPSILGDVFLRNVLAAFDWGELEMHFSGRGIL